MKNIVTFALLIGLSFTQIANATSFTSNQESSIAFGCEKCNKKACTGSCDKKEGKSCKKGKKSCCKKKGKSCKKKEEKTDEKKEDSTEGKLEENK
tara:strand:+ start:4257 stop:4541 length:285 start_codon:yes stop_codon:yes gene_type:complete